MITFYTTELYMTTVIYFYKISYYYLHTTP